MVHLVPSISFVKVLIENIEAGQSVFQAVRISAEQEQSAFSSQVYLWSLQQRNGGEQVYWQPKTHFQLSLMQILSGGLQGAPIYETLKQLLEEMELEFDQQWKRHLETMPVRLSIPLLLFFFPAYIVMLFGPLISKFVMEVQ